MLKNVPDYILIGAHKTGIVATTAGEFEKWWWEGKDKEKIGSEDDDFEVLGYYNHKNNEIHLWAKLLGTRKAATLLHEILEAINWQNDLEMNHTQISTLTESLLALFLNNNLDFNKIIQE